MHGGKFAAVIFILFILIFFFSDQSTCVLCIWRKHLTMSLGIFCGRSLRSMGCLARCYKPFGPYKTVATAWSVEPAISWTRSRLVSARAALCDRLCSWFFLQKVSTWAVSESHFCSLQMMWFLLASLRDGLQLALEWFTASCEAVGMRISNLTLDGALINLLSCKWQ